MKENRGHPRTPLRVDIRISHPAIGSVVLATRDISQTGVFVVSDGSQLPPVGEIVEGQVQGQMDDPPMVKMEVVRVDAEGVGLRFCEE
jgi:hypothetical protein